MAFNFIEKGSLAANAEVRMELESESVKRVKLDEAAIQEEKPAPWPVEGLPPDATAADPPAKGSAKDGKDGK